MTMARFLLFDATPLVSTETATSAAVDVTKSTGYFSLDAKATGTGADIKVEYEVSQDGTNYDVTTTDPTRTILTTLSTNYLVTGFDAPVAKFMRVKLTGNAGNATESVVVTGRLMFTEA